MDFISPNRALTLLFIALFLVIVFAVPGSRAKVSPAQSNSQPGKFWAERDVSNRPSRAEGPRRFRALTLHTSQLQSFLGQLPRENSEQATTSKLVFDLPSPDGGFQSFSVEESSIMEPGLAVRYPQIKTYRGQGIDDPTATTRFDLTPFGFHAIILSSRGTILIEPDAPQLTDDYIAYFQGDMPAGSMECGVSAEEQDVTVNESPTQSRQPAAVSGANLRSYRLAVAATGEYTQRYGSGTVVGGLSAVTTTVNLVDAVYEREVAIRFVLIANEDSIIFTDSVTDGYTSDVVATLISENQTKIDAVIGTTNYDIGHVFDGRAAPAGSFSFQGQASISSVCRAGLKARGASITRSVQPNSVIAYYSTSHEMGHQFGATHTFNATSGACATQRAPGTAYEPGTGSTIMGYRFTCAPEDMMSSDTYFHNASLGQITTYTTTGLGNCATPVATGNGIPTVSAGPNYTIPQGTPFLLTATATDPDGDPLTYCWEEFDLGNPSPPNTDDGSRPIFRSFVPTTSPSRMFPRLADVQTAIPTLGESLPTTTRTMNFRVTVRDNHASAAGINSSAMQLNVRSDAGPFIVTAPTEGATWPTASTQTVTWNVANTNAAPVNCSTVRILLSLDSGNTFPIVLADATPNDGSELVTIPSTTSTQARVKVEAVGNVFFSMSRPFSVSGIAGNTIRFSQTAYSVNEGTPSVTATVTRVGDTSGSATVTVTTTDTDTFTVGCSDRINNAGGAFGRCDYATTVETVAFLAGETSKNVVVPIINDSFMEGSETFGLALSNATGATLGTPSTATVTIDDNDVVDGANPIFTTPFFVRMQYLDFLSREPEPGEPWSGVLNNCSNVNNNPACDRILVSSSFFESQEFQLKGYFVYRFYKLAFNRLPSYSEIVVDMRAVTGSTPNEVFQKKAAFTNAFVQRQEFANLYNGKTNAEYVTALMDRYSLTQVTTPDPADPNGSNKVTLTTAQLISQLNGGTLTGGQVLRAIADSDQVSNAEFNAAFVAMQYFGYLRRSPDLPGFNAWLNYLNTHPGDSRTMVDGFMNSNEYKLRFGP